jgi:hypothetical protein
MKQIFKHFRLLVVLLVPVVAIVGCDPYEQDDYIEKYVVQSYQIADERLAPILLSTTSPINETYTFSGNAVSGATVEVRLLNAQGSVEKTHAYAMQSPGVYTVVDTLEKVIPLRWYEMVIKIAGKPDITARTLVPDRFETLDLNNNSIKYQSSEQFEVDITLSSYPGRQNIYVFSIETLDRENAEFTPFYADILDEDDREDVYINQSGIIFEGNYDIDPTRNTLKIKLPWIGIAFYGPNKITANVIDDALYDFIRTKDVQLGGSTLSPGEINNIASNVENGIGVFGSYARSSMNVFVEK